MIKVLISESQSVNEERMKTSMKNKLPKEWEDAFELVKHNICDTKAFILIRQKFNNILMAHRNLNNLFITFDNALSCATIITFYKVIEKEEKKSLAFLFREVIKELDKTECVNRKLGNKAKKISSMRKRIKPLRDRVWGHALDFRKPTQGLLTRKAITPQEVDSYVNQTAKYFNEIIDLVENAGYSVSKYKIDSASSKKLESEIDELLSVSRFCLKNKKT